MGRVGLEVEIESNTINIREAQKLVTNWVVETDGSLRGGVRAFEVKSAGPCDLALLRPHLAELYPVIAGSSGTWRAAVHVHVDTLGMSPDRRGLALAMAYCTDAALFKRFSPERVESNFSVPLAHKSASVMECIRSIIENNSIVRYGKYSSVNVQPMDTLGTIEFRHMRTPACDGTVALASIAIDTILKFAEACAEIVYSTRVVPNTRTLHCGDGMAEAFLLMLEHVQACRYGGILQVDQDAVGEVLSVLAGIKPFDVTRIDRAALARVVEAPPIETPRIRRAAPSLEELFRVPDPVHEEGGE